MLNLKLIKLINDGKKTFIFHDDEYEVVMMINWNDTIKTKRLEQS